MKTTAIFSVLILAISLNLTASTPQIGEDNLSNKNKAFLYASLTNIEENIREVSAWMLNDKAFKPKTTNSVSFANIPEAFVTVEKRRILEDWMFNDALFSDFEEAAPIEEWMFNDEQFTTPEKLIPLQTWMLDYNTFRIKK